MIGGVTGKSPIGLGIPEMAGPTVKPAAGSGGKTFEQVLNQTAPRAFDLNIHNELLQVERAVAGGKGLPLADLIHLQIKAGQFGLRVELLSKVAESATTTLRKLQSGQ